MARLKIGIIGCGGIANGKHLPSLKAINRVDIVAFCDLIEERAIKAAKEYCNDNDMEIDFTSPGLIAKEDLESINMNVPSCGACLSNMAIAPDGEVIPCQSWLGSSYGLGNILKNDWNSIWNAPSCAKLRSMTDEEALSCPFRKESQI